MNARERKDNTEEIQQHSKKLPKECTRNMLAKYFRRNIKGKYCRGDDKATHPSGSRLAGEEGRHEQEPNEGT